MKLSLMSLRFKFSTSEYLKPVKHWNIKTSLTLSKYFFSYEHYRTAGNSKKSSKYFKAKFYIKSEQTITQTGLNFAELGYCLPNTMRFEIKLERADKFKFMDFSSLEALFGKTAEDTLKEFLAKEFHRIFFFCWQSIDKASLHSVPFGGAKCSSDSAYVVGKFA